MKSEEIFAIIENIANEKGVAITPDTDLFSTGILDSFGVLSVITELETVIGGQIPFERVSADHFRTVAAITEFIDSIHL